MKFFLYLPAAVLTDFVIDIDLIKPFMSYTENLGIVLNCRSLSSGGRRATLCVSEACSPLYTVAGKI